MSNDSISRQAAIEALNGEIQLAKKKDVKSVVDYLTNCFEKLNAIPAADVRENVRGEWIDWSRLGLDGVFVWHRACSKCGYERDDDNIDNDSNFCPNCGADMRKEEMSE